MSLPVNFTLSVYRGDTYAWEFRLWQDRERTLPLDLTGVDAKAEIRDRAGGNLLLDLPLTITLPNTIVADMSPADSRKLTRHKGVWDLRLKLPDDTVATVIAGAVFVRADVTESTPAPAHE